MNYFIILDIYIFVCDEIKILKNKKFNFIVLIFFIA
jgi:hypothetical protein